MRREIFIERKNSVTKPLTWLRKTINQLNCPQNSTRQHDHISVSVFGSKKNKKFSRKNKSG